MTFFGEYLRRLRERAGISQETLAEEAEISSAYISQIESGRRNPPTPDVLRRMAAPLGVPYIVLMRQADHVRDTDLYALLGQAIRALFVQDPGREQLELLLREAVDRWTAFDATARQNALDAVSADHIGEILLEALLQKQSDLIFEQLFRTEEDESSEPETP
jgi:transcriptional regulator with XRE-family HTH domain